jgi:signal transduction histidine kinase
MRAAIGAIVLLIAVLLLASAMQTALRRSSADLVAERGRIESHLPRLASMSPATGIGPSGCVFRTSDSKDSGWIELEWPVEQTISEVVIAPILQVEPNSGLVRALGWCQELQVISDTDEVVARRSFTPKAAELPAPHVLTLPALKTRRLRLQTVSFGTQRNWKVAEVLVFADGRNIAGDATIRVAPEFSYDDSRLRSLIDAQYPYEMVGSGGGAPPYRRQANGKEVIEVSIKLPKPVQVEQIMVFPADRSITIPKSSLPGHGFPRAIQIIAQRSDDPTDTTALVDQEFPEIISSNPLIMTMPAAAPTCQIIHFRFTGLLCSLAEIQVIANNRNIAKGVEILSSNPQHERSDRLKNLFDGKNRFGDILPIDQWMGELAERQALELRLAELDVLQRRLHDRSARLLHWAVVMFICAIGVCSLLYIWQLTRLKALALESHELLLAELHDEIGASLHAIRMFAEIAEEAPGAGRLEIVSKIRKLAAATADSVRRVTHLLDEGLTPEMFVSELKQHGKWLPAHVQCTLDMDMDAQHLARFSPANMGHLLRFYHECLANINRHADGVVTVCVTFSTSASGVSLIVENDGKAPDDPAEVPRSLQRRARLARGKLTASTRDGGDGFRTQLVIKTRQWL